MKKLFLLAITIFTLASCSGNSDNANDEEITELKPLLKNITNNGDFTGTYTYDGEKVLKYTDSKYSTNTIIFTYTNDLITEIKESSNIYSYAYENNKLVSMDQQSYQGVGVGFKKWGKTVYTYPSAFEIEGKFYQYDQNDVLRTIYSSRIKYTINNSGNITKIENFGEFGSQVNSSISYEYDNKNNCFKNVLGFNKLLDPERCSMNNILKTVSQTRGYGEGVGTYTYLYDDKGYPTSKAINLGTSNSSSLTLVY